jgi:FKBP-type peptidyl-prolyl cis-trans isomerase FklB
MKLNSRTAPFERLRNESRFLAALTLTSIALTIGCGDKPEPAPAPEPAAKAPVEITPPASPEPAPKPAAIVSSERKPVEVAAKAPVKTTPPAPPVAAPKPAAVASSKLKSVEVAAKAPVKTTPPAPPVAAPKPAAVASSKGKSVEVAAKAPVKTTPPASPPTSAKPVQLNSTIQKVSYVIGHNIGSSIAKDALGLDETALTAAIKGALAKQPSKVSPQEQQAAMTAFQQHMMAKRQPGAPAASAMSKEQTKTVSSVIGNNIGSGIVRDGIDADANIFVAALKAGLAKQPSQISEEDSKSIMTAFQAEAKVKKEAEAKLLAKAGEDFLEANKKKKGVTVTKSGLQYEVIKSGNGKTPTTADKVTTHYTGTLVDGTKFDSSVDRGTPATFPVTGVIKGWTEALQLMKEGDKWRLFIPYQLAYGPQGRPGSIPPAAMLIFEIELIKVN